MNKLAQLFIEKDSLIHRIDGSLKLIAVILWTLIVFQFNDIRIFSLMIVIGLFVLILAKIPFKSILAMFTIIIVFTIFNSILLLLISPTFGSELTNTYTKLIKFDSYVITYETLWYALTLSAKYICLLPVTLIFLFTTHPSKFASSLNRIGVNYKIAYSVSITLRYFPTVFDEYSIIKSASQMKGVNFEVGSPLKKLKNQLNIIIPLVVHSISKIDVISMAMDLRCFGKYSTRTWYNRVNFQKLDYVVMVLLILLLVMLVILIIFQEKVFYYPF